jgi:hypothetical protein
LRPSFGGQEWIQNDISDDFFSRSESGPFPSDTEQEIAFIKSHLKSGPILDLGCGDMRLDLSFLCLQRSKQKNCIQADYRKLPLKGRFKLIILAFGQICFLPRTELKSFLNGLRKYLEPKGLIYLDLPAPTVFEEMNDRNTWEMENDSLTIWNRQFQPTTEVLSQQRLSFDRTGNPKSDVTFSYQSYSFFELLELFSHIRLQTEYNGEDLEGTPVGEESEWMYFLLKKN